MEEDVFPAKSKKKSTKIKAQIPEQDHAIHTIHFAVTSLLHPFTMQEIYDARDLQLKVVFRSRHTDTVKL